MTSHRRRYNVILTPNARWVYDYTNTILFELTFSGYDSVCQYRAKSCQQILNKFKLQSLALSAVKRPVYPGLLLLMSNVNVYSFSS